MAGRGSDPILDLNLALDPALLSVLDLRGGVLDPQEDLLATLETP